MTKLLQYFDADRRGTLGVRANIKRQIKFKPGQRVYADVFTNHVVVSKDNGLKSRKKVAYTVDKNGAIRVTDSLFKKAGISKRNYGVKFFKNSLEIR